MLNLSCTYCRAPINLSDGDLARAMQAVEGKRPKSIPVPCPNCRRINKAPYDRLARVYRLAGSPPAPADVDAHAETDADAETVENEEG